MAGSAMHRQRAHKAVTSDIVVARTAIDRQFSHLNGVAFERIVTVATVEGDKAQVAAFDKQAVTAVFS